jgi:peptidyl-prolyl cis-trans isomerase C
MLRLQICFYLIVDSMPLSKKFGLSALGMVIALALMVAGIDVAFAQAAKKNSTTAASVDASPSVTSGGEALPIVNGSPIDSRLYNQVLKENIDAGAKDSESLKIQLKDQLITRQLLLQEVSKTGLDKTPQAVQGANLAKENFLINLLIREYDLKHPITDERVKAEYDRQISLIGGAEAQQYLVKAILTAKPEQAHEVIAQLKSGAKFADLAEKFSIDDSKSKGGDLGWLLPSQTLPVIGNVIANLPVGSFSQTPIQTANGWFVIKVEQQKPYKAPSLEESKPVLIQTLLAQQHDQYVFEMVQKAKITR